MAISVANMDRPRWRELTEKWQIDEVNAALAAGAALTMETIGSRIFVENDELATWLYQQANSL